MNDNRFVTITEADMTAVEKMRWLYPEGKGVAIRDTLTGVIIAREGQAAEQLALAMSELARDVSLATTRACCRRVCQGCFAGLPFEHAWHIHPSPAHGYPSPAHGYPCKSINIREACGLGSGDVSEKGAKAG